MNKKEILQNLESSREAFLDLIDDLDEAALTQPGAWGDWSIKDLLSHLSHWEAELVRLLWQVKQGQVPNTAQIAYQGKVDDINKAWQSESASRPLERVLDDFHSVRNQTINRVEEFMDSDLTNPTRYKWQAGKPLAEWIENDSFGHEQEHTPDIQAWRAKNQPASK